MYTLKTELLKKHLDIFNTLPCYEDISNITKILFYAKNKMIELLNNKIKKRKKQRAIKLIKFHLYPKCESHIGIAQAFKRNLECLLFNFEDN